MKENKYDDSRFFGQYSRMTRSTEGLNGAGEWPALRRMLPGFGGKRVLDLGCGFGWHCRYAAEQGATTVVGIDLSEKMLDQAARRNGSPLIEYKRMAVEDFEFLPGTFDVVISSLAFHYLESFDEICRKVNRCLTPGGCFVFSVEHPVFTAYGNQEWYCDEKGEPLHWPVDRYFLEGRREAVFLGEAVVKYHKTLTAYINGLIRAGFEITALEEPQPGRELLEAIPEMKNELRRPMMLIVSARKI